MKKVYLFFTLGILSSCSVGPDYEKPEVPLKKEFTQTNHLEQTKQPLREIKWWHSFDDPVLEVLIDKAHKQNSEYKIALKTLEIAQSKIDGLTGYLFPKVDLVGSIIKRSNSLNGAENSPTSRTYTTLQTGFQTTWELDLFGAAKHGIESAMASKESLENDAYAIKLNLTASVAKMYILYLNAKVQTELTQEIVHCLELSVKLNKKLTKAGQLSKLQTISGESSLRSAKSRLLELQSTEKTTLSQLANLLGEESLDCLNAPNRIPYIQNINILSNIKSDVIKNRPDVMSAERKMAAENANIGLEKSRLFPSFSLIGDYVWQSLTPSTLINGKSASFSIGPYLRLPIFDFGQIQSDIDAQVNKYDISVLNYQKTILSALQDIESNLVDFDKNNDQLHLSKEDMFAYKQAYTLSTKRYKAGLDSRLILLAQKITYLNAQASYMSSLTNLNLSFINVYKALGGGWDS